MLRRRKPRNLRSEEYIIIWPGKTGNATNFFVLERANFSTDIVYTVNKLQIAGRNAGKLRVDPKFRQHAKTSLWYGMQFTERRKSRSTDKTRRQPYIDSDSSSWLLRSKVIFTTNLTSYGEQSPGGFVQNSAERVWAERNSNRRTFEAYRENAENSHENFGSRRSAIC